MAQGLPAPAPVRRGHWWWPQSLRGRYVIISAVLAALLWSGALAGWLHVRHGSGAQTDRIQARALASAALADLEAQVQDLENHLSRSILRAEALPDATLQEGLAALDAAARRLQRTPWIEADPLLRELSEQIAADVGRLGEALDRLVAARARVARWFPAMGIMEDTMLPANETMASAIQAAIEDLDQDPARGPGAVRVQRRFLELRHAVTRMVSEFRLLVANRFGVFSTDPTGAMRTRQANVRQWAAAVRTTLARLQAEDAAGYLGLQQQVSLEEAQAALDKWLAGYEQVMDLILADRWRADLHLLQREVDPLVARIRQRLGAVDLELAVGSARDITRLSATASRLAHMVLVIAAAGTALLVLGFFTFDHWLLRPISMLAAALKAEGAGRPVQALPRDRAAETRALAEAFEEMRNEIRLRQARLDFLAHHDPLTSLPNRILFRDRLQHAVERARRHGQRVGLLFLDLDRFKQINDSLGHEAGDQLLQGAAERLARCVRHIDTVARLGGDEFAVLVEDVEQMQQLVVVAQKILRAFEAPFAVMGRQLRVTTSIGIAIAPADGDDVDTLIKNADAAMYHSKERGPNGFQFYSGDMTVRITEYLMREQELRQAVLREEFELYYQPIVDTATGLTCACEALLRWHHPRRGVVPPAEFMEILEETGLIVPLTHWLIPRALADHRAFTRNASHPVALTINLSARLLDGKAAAEAIAPALAHGGFSASDLVVEITEDSLMQQGAQAEEALAAIKALGVRIAIDDFGTGQSSLGRLRSFPIDVVKVDRSFVADVPVDEEASELVTAIIAMTHGLKKHVVAEGVESAAQFDFLSLAGCDAVQGFLFSRPVPAAKVADLLDGRLRMCG